MVEVWAILDAPASRTPTLQSADWLRIADASDSLLRTLRQRP